MAPYVPGQHESLIIALRKTNDAIPPIEEDYFVPGLGMKIGYYLQGMKSRQIRRLEEQGVTVHERTVT